MAEPVWVETWDDFGLVALVDLNKSHVTADAGTIRAFVETGSRSPFVIATIANYGPNAPWCYSCIGLDYNGNLGVLISIKFSEPVGNQHRVKILIAHEGAQRYQEPIPYPN
jgi:hypothetical protein